MMKFHQWFGSGSLNLLITGWCETSSGYTSLYINLIRCVCAYFTYSSSGQHHSPQYQSVSGHPCAPDAPCKFTVVDNQHMLLRHRHGPVFTGNSSRLKQVAPLLTCTPAGNKKRYPGKNYSTFAENRWVENGVAGVKFTTAQKCAAMGFSFSARKVFSE